MMRAVRDYFARLVAAFGEGWNHFWFTPSDPATLGVIRILTGLMALYLHGSLLPDLVTFFGAGGLLPPGDIGPLEGNTFSYLNYIQARSELITVHVLGLAVLALFTSGLWTRVTSILALVVFLSDVQRAPMITGRTEPIVAMLIAYLCIGPSGRRFSIDRLLADRNLRPGQEPAPELWTSATIATRLIQVHLVLWIAMMGFSKLTGDTWWSGLGMWWLIARRESRLVDLSWLYRHPDVIDVWTHAIVLFELAFPLLVWNRLARPLLLGIAALVWTSLALVTGDITFALALGTAALAFVSPETVLALSGRFWSSAPQTA